MGYCMDMKGIDASFKKENANKIINTIQENIKNKNIDGGYVDFNYILKSDDILEIFEEFRFPLILIDDEYQIEYFSGEKYGGYEEDLFSLIAPYMNDGYMEFIGEDGYMWRYLFKDGKFKEISATIIWEE